MAIDKNRGFLLVPIRADALCLSAEAKAIDAPADFSKLPFVDEGDHGLRDFNSGAAHVSDHLLSTPFSDVNARLERGVHLHWAMPDTLTWARSVKAAGDAPLAPPAVDFPAVPNRWLIVRSGGGHAERRWMVESDYLWPRGTVRTAEQVSYPAPDGNGYRYLGRVVALEEWSEGEEHLPKLTVVGYGEPTFAALYTNSRNVFAFHDDETEGFAEPLIDLDPPLTYDVFGWFATSAQDPLQEQLAGLASAQTLRAAVEKKLEWRLEEAGAADVPARTLCYARVRLRTPATHPTADRGSVERNVEIAIGNTDTEALSGWLARRLTGEFGTEAALRVEDHLEALHLTASMRKAQTDLGPKFEEARHARAFSPAGSGRLWEVRPEAQRDVSAQAASSDAAARARLLPPDFARQQQRLNELQLEYDRSAAELDSLRHAIYSDWHRYITCCYVVDPLSNPYPDADVAKRHLERQVALFRLMSAYVGRIAYDPAGPTWTALASEHFGELRKWASETIDHLLAGQRAPFRAWLDEVRREVTPQRSLAARLADAVTALHASVQRNNQIGDLAAHYASTLSAAEAAATPKKPNAVARKKIATDAVMEFQRGWKQLFGDLKTVAGWDANVSKRFNAFFAQQTPEDGLKAASQALQNWLQSLITTFPRWVLHQVPAPRFWAPNDPVILLAGPGVRSTDRHGEDHLDSDDGLLRCQRLDVTQKTFFTKLDAATTQLVQRLNEIETAWRATHAGANPPGFRNSDGDPWHPLLVEWEVRLSGLPRKAKESERFPESFLTSNFDLGETNSEFLEQRFELPLRDTQAATFVGRSILTPFAREKLELEIDVFLAGQVRQYLELKKTGNALTSEEAALLVLDAAEGDTASRLLAFLDVEANRSALETALRETLAGVPFDDAPRTPLQIVLDARDELRTLRAQGHDVQSQTLGGFHDSLLMQRRAMQLPVSDPLGFPDYRAFTESVIAPIVGRANTRAPASTLPFHPLRTGAMQFVQVSLIDTWGRVTRLNNVNNIARPARMDTDRSDGEWISLAPRLTQPSRVQFRWLSANDELAESIADPETSPICGWFVPNDLDGSLHVYEGDGRALGYIDQLGRWRTPPGRVGPPLPDDIANPRLARAVRWICKSARDAAVQLAETRAGAGATPSADEQSAFINDLFGVFETALDAIDPDGFEEHDSRALLISRPLALVRATVDLQLGGLPATHQSWEAFRECAEKNSAPRTDEFTKVKVEIRIGEHDQLEDGVVGYWIEDGRDGFRDQRLFAPQSQLGAPQTDRRNLVLWNGEGESPLNLRQSFEDSPHVLSILMDPRGVVHCTTGVLPTKTLTIPKAHYADALKSLEVAFLTSPILTPPLSTELPLPSEPHSTWAWIQRDGALWTELTATPVIELEFVRNASPDGDAIWMRLIESGWIDPLADTGRASIRPVNARTSKTLDRNDGWKTREAAILQLLSMGARALRAATTDARFGATYEIREGWLALQHPVPLA